jgi:hypothetical protein
VAAATGKPHRIWHGHENDCGEELFDELARARGLSLTAATLVKQAWVIETFRKMRHSWALLARYMEAENLTHEDILTPKAAVIAANFKAQAEAAGVRGLEALYTHTNMLLNIFRKNGDTLAKLQSRATRRRHPRNLRKYSTMWDIQKMLRYVGTALAVNSRLSDSQLLAKTLFLTMVFSVCRITELTKLTIAPE